MQIECKECKTIYSFKETGLPKNTVKVKCPRCAHFMIIESKGSQRAAEKDRGSNEIGLESLQERINGLLQKIKLKNKEVERLRATIKTKDEELRKKENQLKYKNEQLTHLHYQKEGFLTKIFSKKKTGKKQEEEIEFNDADIERID